MFLMAANLKKKKPLQIKSSTNKVFYYIYFILLIKSNLQRGQIPFIFSVFLFYYFLNSLLIYS